MKAADFCYDIFSGNTFLILERVFLKYRIRSCALIPKVYVPEISVAIVFKQDPVNRKKIRLMK